MDIKITSGPAIEKTGDLVALLSSLGVGDVLFIDEIHLIPRVVEEVIYSAMEDYMTDIVIDKLRDSRSIRIEWLPFTLIGSITRFVDLSHPLRERFGAVFRLNYYTKGEIKQIVRITSKVYDNHIDETVVEQFSKQSKRAARIANRLCRLVRDFDKILTNAVVTLDITVHALSKLGNWK